MPSLPLQGSALNRDVGTTFRMFEELQQRGIEVHAAHLMWLITACGTNWQVDKALSLFWTMEKQYGITPNPSCFNALLIALARSGRYDLLESNTLRAKNGYNTSICSKTVAFVLHSALQLEVYTIENCFPASPSLVFGIDDPGRSVL